MCDFCKIINKEIKAYVPYESDKNIVFLDYEPINEGHVLICPKVHEDSITKIPDDVLKDMLVIIRKVVAAFEARYGAKGYTIMQNGGANCDYGHFHVHVFPRFEGDGFGWFDSCKPHAYNQEVSDGLKELLM
ncbi:MAG: HIT family protein [Saccharofermentans sp.]|nr:HIT family protein [Saccharofermentans sp.]